MQGWKGLKFLVESDHPELSNPGTTLTIFWAVMLNSRLFVHGDELPVYASYETLPAKL